MDIISFKYFLLYTLNEDGSAPANSVGGGNIAGVGVTPQGAPSNWGEPGIDLKRKKKIILQNMNKRKPPIGVGM